MTPSRLHRELARLTSGEVYTDAVSREPYATAACLFRIVPRAVACPRREDEIAAILRFAAEQGIPVTARGAGSSVAGQALGEGIILDFTRHLNQVLEVAPDRREVCLQPGIILSTLNRQMKKHGLFFPPDPSSADYATLGGMIANNSSGAHSLKYGDTRKWVKRLKVALADGTIAWLDPPQVLEGPNRLLPQIHTELPPLLSASAAALERSRPQVAKNSSGYHVWDLLGPEGLRLSPLVVGSEGTLAVVLNAVLKLAPLPAARAAALLVFSSVEEACAAVEELRPLEPAALEIMDHLVVSLVREHRPDLHPFLPQSAQAVLLVEFEADRKETADQLVAQAGQKIFRPPERRTNLIVPCDEAEAAKLFAVRQAASPILYRLPGRRLTRFIEDLVLPPGKLPEGISRLQEILSRHGTEAPVLGHAGSGNLHLNPRLDLTDPADRQRMLEIADEVYALVISLGGSVSGEHGDGILRPPYVRRQFAELVPLFHKIKSLFDPHGILNPGKILSADETIPLHRLRFTPITDRTESPRLAEEPVREILLRCHGCGLCRSYCPVAAVLEEEAALPRAKVSVLRALGQGGLGIQEDDDKKKLERILSLCTACQRCLSGCPTGIEPARVIRAFLTDRHQRRGRGWREKIFLAAPDLLRVGSRFPGTVGAAARNHWLRILGEYGLGIAQDAPLPLPARDLLKRESRRNKGTDIFDNSAAGPEDGLSAGSAVVFYPGCLGRFADREEESWAAVEVLRGLGFRVLLPRLDCCGEPALQVAELNRAKAAAEKMIRALSPYTDRGLPVVSTCPSCALMFQHEYPALIGEPALPLSRLAREFLDFVREPLLRRPAEQFAKPPFEAAVLHQPCHAAARTALNHAAAVLSSLPGLNLMPLDNACCGQAGIFGLRRENRNLSRALGARLRKAAEETGTRRVISSCPACRLQIRSLGLQAESAVKVIRWSMFGGTGG